MRHCFILSNTTMKGFARKKELAFSILLNLGAFATFTFLLRIFSNFSLQTNLYWKYYSWTISIRWNIFIYSFIYNYYLYFIYLLIQLCLNGGREEKVIDSMKVFGSKVFFSHFFVLFHILTVRIFQKFQSFGSSETQLLKHLVRYWEVVDI